MGQIADTAEAIRRRSRGIARLMCSTSLISPPLPEKPDHAQDRLTIAQAYLGRTPVFLRHPWSGSVIWVESEPDDWRDLLKEAQATALAALARKARAN